MFQSVINSLILTNKNKYRKDSEILMTIAL